MAKQLPQPESYRIWQDWATKLIGAISAPVEKIFPEMPRMSVAQIGNIKPIAGLGLVLAVDEAGGSVPVFADGTNWRRVTDRAVMS